MRETNKSLTSSNCFHCNGAAQFLSIVRPKLELLQHNSEAKKSIDIKFQNKLFRVLLSKKGQVTLTPVDNSIFSFWKILTRDLLRKNLLKIFQTAGAISHMIEQFCISAINQEKSDSALSKNFQIKHIAQNKNEIGHQFRARFDPLAKKTGPNSNLSGFY